jgi:diadenosine tetraphosphate (Ap4A) HIT family hydrolase
MQDLLIPPKEAIYYEDDLLYVCLASCPITHGHSVVVWKERVEDLHLLSRDAYLHLMMVVDNVRNVLQEMYSVEKVYLLYMDEIKHVHWHLVPRYDEEGINILTHSSDETDDFSDAEELGRLFSGEPRTA